MASLEERGFFLARGDKRGFVVLDHRGDVWSLPRMLDGKTKDGPLRALVVGEEWGQLYVSNFHEILTLYRQGGINFLGVFQNASAQIESRYGKEALRIWKKAVSHTLYRGLPDTETLRDIEHRSGRTSVMVRGFNVNQNQVNGSGDSLSEQSRPLLQDLRLCLNAVQSSKRRLLKSPSYCVQCLSFAHIEYVLCAKGKL